MNPIDYRAITARQQATWATGDFNEIARQIIPVSEALVRACDPRAGQRVLDVACGSGNAALIAARRYCEVSGIDYVPSLIERAAQRAAAEGTPIDFRVGDAQALDFPDGHFDLVLSVFGVMFAPDQERAAGELLRVCRPGGKIGLCCWIPEGFGGEFFRIVARYVPPPEGLKTPFRWGTEAGVTELLGAGSASIAVEKRVTHQYYRSIDHAFEVCRAYLGPISRALQMLDAANQASLRRDLMSFFETYNRATDGTVVMEGEYLEIVARRRS
jgi:ubiquinone/menaquinone biosynthesis C-methylase UbiE